MKDEEEGNDPWSPHGGSPKPKRAARRAERERSPTPHERDQDRGRDRERCAVGQVKGGESEVDRARGVGGDAQSPADVARGGRL